jgi:Mg2+ and Co2+ transporter CorA
MQADEHLLLVLHAPPKPEDVERVGRFFWRDNQGAWSSDDLGGGIAALNKHLDEYETVLATLDRQEEEAKTANDYFEVLVSLSPFRRAAVNLHHVLQEARKTFPAYHEIIDARDRAYTIERNVELLTTETKNALDLTVARRAEEQARASRRMERASHRLNILAAIFFPIATVAAIFGIDLETLAALIGRDRQSLVDVGLLPLLFLGLIVVGLTLGGLITLAINRGPQSQDGGGENSKP